MGMIRSDVLCPSCLNKLGNKDIYLKCSKCGKEVEPPRFQIFSRGAIRCNATPGCNGFLTGRACNNCHSELPADIMDYEKYLRFSIVGIKGAGKTNFLTAMLHELRNTPGNPWVTSPMNDETATNFNDNDKLIFTENEPVGATAKGIVQPQLWRIKDKSRMTNKTIPSYSMTIFDGAGEDFEDIIRADEIIKRYIRESKALVILIDPLALPNIAAKVSSDVLNWSTTTTHDSNDSGNMVQGIADYIRTACGLPPSKLIDRDVAVVFTKMDVMMNEFKGGYVTQPSPHLARKAFVKSDADAVDEEIRLWLEDNGENSFIDAIDTNFRSSRLKYFGVSSFGQPPKGASRLSKVTPHRVLDPLIWMFSKEGIVPVVS